jgi:hypothetical protein
VTWRERLVAMEAGDGPTDQDRLDAARWATCAVEEARRQHPDVVLFNEWGPADPELLLLGARFHLALDYRTSSEAHAVLDAIEDRVLTLKREAGA